MSGLAIFGTLGYMAQDAGVPIADVARGGLGLAFEVFPNAINMLPGGTFVVALFGIVFFLTMLTLGIDSAFSLVEATIAGVADKWGKDKYRTTVGVILAAALISLLYATKAGLYWVDLVDHYINSYALIMAGIMETIAIGYFYRTESIREYFNSVSEIKFGKWWTFMIKILPIILFVLLVRYFVEDIKVPYEGYAAIYQWLGGWGLIIVVGVLALVLTKIKSRYNALDADKAS